MQTIQNYLDYTKCGEILKPPSGNYQRPYILKCFQCSEIYLIYEAFIFHVEDHCKNFIKEKLVDNEHISEICKSSTNRSNTEQESKNSSAVKTEGNQVMLTEDPITHLKQEHTLEYDISSLLEIELKTPGLNRNKDLQQINKECNEKNNTKFSVSDDLVEKSDNNSEEEGQNSDEDMENSSDAYSCDEDGGYEIPINKNLEGDLTDVLNSSAPGNDVLKSKVYIISLIDAYKNQPTLWNKNFPFLRHKSKRQQCYQDIANELKKQHDLSITWNQVANAIIFLCRKYREDLKGFKEIKEGGENYTASWFFENLNFLKPFMENNQIAKLDSHLPDLMPNQIIEILQIYKGLPHLWNTQMIEHYCKNKIVAAKQEMVKALDKNLGIKISDNILEEYFRTINNCFARAKRNNAIKSDTKSNKINSDAYNEDYYSNMLFLYDHVGSFNCSECTRSFKSPMYLKIHQAQAHGFEPLPCSLCQKKFKAVSSYINHAKRHMKDLNHECKECGKKFLQSNELEVHMRNHTGARPYCCEICGASYRHIQSFTIHKRRHINKYLHTCEICGKGFYTKDRYKDHMNSHTNTRNQVCKVCGKTFITKRALRQHAVMHDDVRRHSCKLCGKAFKHKTGVTQHMRTHGVTTSEEKYPIKRDV